MREALTLLRRGECVCVIADQDAGRDGVFVPFLGTPASTPPGPAEFALRAGTPILFGAMHRTTEGRLRRASSRRRCPFPTGSTTPRPSANSPAARGGARDVVRAHPAQWLWTHRRWKTPPPAAAQRPASPAPRSPSWPRACSSSRRSRPDRPRRGRSAAARPAPLPESTFDGAGSTIFPLERARVRRLFEDVRIRRLAEGWEIVADEWFEAGVAPATAVFGLPDYRASLAGASDSSTCAARCATSR